MNTLRLPLKVQILADLDKGEEVIIETKYIKPIWGDTEALLAWCESWKLVYEFFQETGVNRKEGDKQVPIQWLEITRAPVPSELDTTSDEEEKTVIDEHDDY